MINKTSIDNFKNANYSYFWVSDVLSGSTHKGSFHEIIIYNYTLYKVDDYIVFFPNRHIAILNYFH